MKCSTARNTRVLNGSVLAFNMWAESHQVEHSHDNDDRCGDGCQREAHKRPFNHCLWHSWQPLATWQLLRKQALQWSEEKKRQNAIKQVRATWLFYSQLSADSMHEWFTAGSFKERNLSELKTKKLHVQNRMSDVICRVRRASIVSCRPVNAGDSFHAMFPFSDHLILAQCAQKHKSFSLMLLLLVPIGWVGAGGRVTKGY